ncbi:MAG: RNA polymerase sigma factor RpoH [Gammaproteobacteria bacterium]|nr:RNA polymerase sigma factor RpoH [Gammaproteobacteria bacterium]
MTETALVPSQRDLILAGPVGSLDAYVQTVKAIPVLSRQEELELARKFLDENDLDAARTLVMSQLRFVVHIARSYAGYGLPIGDLIQEGNIGLMKAVKRFDPEVGVRLITYAVHWIRAEIHEFVLRNWRLVKVATTKAQRKLFFNLRKAKKNLGWLSAEETEAVAEDLGVSPHEVTEMESRLSSYDLSFDPTPDADEESTYAPAMYLPNSELNPADALETENTAQHASAGLQDALESLDQRSREILQARWLTEQKETLHTLADRYGVSAERIRQIEAAAIRKLRAEIPPA